MAKNKTALGVFFCDCGGEISKVIDFERLSDIVSKMEDVKFVKRHSFLCGKEGKKEIETGIREGANRIVIGACSPKLYEVHFRRFLAESGLNPYCLEMANLREQCAWPHRNDPAGAEEKARRIVMGAVERARRLLPVEKKEFEINKSVLVIGGGVAGLQAAIDVADYGFPVHLVEKEPIIGGNALKLGLAFPANDGAFCTSSPEFMRGIRKCFYRAGLSQHPNLKLYTMSEVKEAKGSFGDFMVKVESKPRGVQENLCINCGKCLKVCPIDVADETNYGLSKHKAIYLPYPNALPPAYVINWKNCNKCGECVKACPTNAINLSDEVIQTELKVGSIIVATGFKEYDPSGIKQYKYGKYPDVITQLQLARILDPYGPSKGRLIKPSNGQMPKSVVMIQCVGSRDEKTNPYCSNVCCTLALKHAINIKEEYGNDVEVYFLYMDIRTVGKEYEDYFIRARELGVKFVRGKPSAVTRESVSGNLIVQVEDTLLSKPIEIETDMVVLSVAMTPTTGTRELAGVLGIDIGNYGFVKEIYPKLKPSETTVKGIYVCGGAHGPKDIPTSITQADAAAFHAILNLSKEKIERDMDIACVDESSCDGCEVCVEVCPYKAIQMVEAKGKNPIGLVARISEAMCNRCGSCASRCPTGAIQLQRWNDDQFLGQISSILSKDGGSLSPKVIAFCCDECGYATVDLLGMGGMSYPVNMLTFRVPCLGWVSLYHIFKTFEFGADGILLVGCLYPNCQHIKGNIYAENVVEFAKQILDEIGLDGRRIRTAPVCAADPRGFLTAAESLIKDLKGLGSLKKE